jgi:predicted NUDIX family NTP pyrophosphohydrolase
MKKKSAGILLYRLKNKKPEVLLVHPGGPFWKNKDDGSWTIPKGEVNDDEEFLTAAIREFHEETGTMLQGDFIELTPVRQKSGKQVYAWALQGDLDESAIQSNFFEIEWPPKSGKKQSFPEIDRAGWFSIEEANKKINDSQTALLAELFLFLPGKHTL